MCMCAEGKRAAKKHDCKYAEVSATIGHNVDQLLVGVLQQIRLSLHYAEIHQFARARGGLDADSNCLSAAAASGDSWVGQAVCLDPGCVVQIRHRILHKLLSSLTLGSSATSASACDNLYVL